MPASPSSVLHKAKGLGLLFHICVSIPTLLAVIYFGFLANDVYVSESRFVVRSPNKPETNGFGFLLKTVGYSSGGDEVYAANDYLASRDALRELNQKSAVTQAYGASNISIFDRFNPLGYDGSFEALYKYFTHKVTLQYETSTSISTLTVRAYSAQDAQRFNAELLRQAEGLVNRLNEQSRTDLMAVSAREVARSREQARKTAQALSAFRDRSAIIDPEKQAGVQLQMISKIQDELIASRIQLDQVRAIARDSSEIPALQARIAGLEAAIDAELHRVAGGKGSLSKAAIEYQRLLFDNEFAQKQLTATLASYEEARLDTIHKQAYVERIVAPNLPDDAEEPHRLRGIFAALAMGLIAWGILSMLLASLRDHVE